MKAGYRVLLIALCAWMQLTGYALVSNPSAQESAAGSTTATNNRVSNEEGTTLPAEGENRATAAHEPTHRKSVSGKIPLPKPANAVKANRSRGAGNQSPGLTSRSLIDRPQPASIKPIAADKATNRSSPMRPAASLGIGGGNFRNRHLTPIPQSIGGPARTTRSTAALSGTGMSRRRLN
jgi:hypothetical protein